MNKSLIISPTGCDPFFSDEYDKENHWRFNKPGRSYDVCLVIFDPDYTPPDGTFDWYIRYQGKKWAMLPKILNAISWEDYDYILYWDDDYATDIQSLEKALAFGRANDLRLFQQSLISWTVYPILKHNPNLVLSETNFIELGVPIFRNDIFRKVVRFFKDYTPGPAEWGMDKVLCYYLQQTAHVFHDSHIKHMRPESSYNKEDGFKEMDYLMKEWFPKYMKEKFDLEYIYDDKQVAFKEWTRP